jgi:uncharacterized protein YllA (UPF0747 family)
MSEPGCYRLPLSEYPRMSRFVLDWLDGKAEEFLPRDGVETRRAGPRGSSELVDALIASNRNWGLDVADEVKRWAAGDGVTIIGGQQVNFAGGPLYILAKLASMLKMRREAERRGEKATLFFWMATEDHDFDEVATLAIPKSAVDPSRLSNPQRDLIYLHASRAVETRGTVGPAPVPDNLKESLLSLLPMERPRWLREGVTFRDSFAELIGEVLGGEKIVLVDALLPEVRRAGAEVVQAVHDRWAEIQREIGTRSVALASAGYTPQVHPREGAEYTLLYELAGGTRTHYDPTRSLPRPESISTTALTRPLLQDFIFHPDVFIGGPAEVSYYAQIARLYEMLAIPRPRVALRGHVLVGPKRVVKMISRYSIEPRDVFSAPDELAKSGHEEEIRRVEAIAGRAEKDLMAHIEEIAEIALPADHALARSITRSIGHIEYHFGKLTERSIRALVRKDRERYQAIRELVSIFHPDGHVQDRVVAWFPWWNQVRETLLERVAGEIEPDASSFKIIGL